jgi:hypothetical protein
MRSSIFRRTGALLAALAVTITLITRRFEVHAGAWDRAIDPTSWAFPKTAVAV